MSTATPIKPTTVRLEEPVKEAASDLLGGMGLSLNTYINMAVRQLVNQQRIPFEVLPAAPQPSEETRKAMIAAEAKSLGLLTDNSPSFSNANDVMAFLEAE